MNIGFSSRCTEEMLQNSKVLFPFPDQHKLFLNGPKRIMGRVVVKPIVTRERHTVKNKKSTFKDASKKPGVIALSLLSGIDQILARLWGGIRGSI